MISCKLGNNILKTDSCGYSLPQIVDLYIANYGEVKIEGNDEVTAVTAVGDAKFYHVEPAKNSVTFTDELVVNDNGTKYRTHTITFSVNGEYNELMHNNLDTLSLGRFVVVAKLADGSYIVLGRNTGLEATESSFAGGGDTNGVTVTLAADVTESALPLKGEGLTAFEGLIEPDTKRA